MHVDLVSDEHAFGLLCVKTHVCILLGEYDDQGSTSCLRCQRGSFALNHAQVFTLLLQSYMSLSFYADPMQSMRCWHVCEYNWTLRVLSSELIESI